jgi:hypothetical protein
MCAYLDVMHSLYFVFFFGFVDFAFIFGTKSSYACAYSVSKRNAKLLWFSLFECSCFICTLHWGFGFVCFFGLGFDLFAD